MCMVECIMFTSRRDFGTHPKDNETTIQGCFLPVRNDGNVSKMHLLACVQEGCNWQTIDIPT